MTIPITLLALLELLLLELARILRGRPEDPAPPPARIIYWRGDDPERGAAVMAALHTMADEGEVSVRGENDAR
jgi:hypothetical protein